MRRLSVLVCALLGTSLFAQSNTINGLDVKLGIEGIRYWGRLGSYPTGTSAFSLATTSCNSGSVQVVWESPMNPDHPYIAFLIAVERNGRIEQISDRSQIKHGFFALNDPGCGTCQPSGSGTRLGIGCQDTYSTGNNGDMYYLGPPDELNPWLVSWNPVGSHFDRGEPDVGFPANQDGQRSLTRTQVNNLGAVGHRIRVNDADLSQAGGELLYCQSQYAIRGEAESRRHDTLGSRGFTAQWSGSSWILFLTNTPIVFGSVLSRWNGATVTSNTNGTDDGRYYVGVKVTGPVNGLYHYEYAVHNRDSVRGANALRIPICAQALVRNVSFRDIDAIAANDWTGARNAGELVFTAASGNELLWNEFFNFAFDSDAGPASGGLVLDQFRQGAGQATVTVPSDAPLALNNLVLGPGCGNANVPLLHATGSPARATLGNGSFGLALRQVAPAGGCFFLLSTTSANLALGSGCTAYLDLAQPFIAAPVVADQSGVATVPLPIPTDLSLEGANLFAQAVEYQPNGGLLFGALNLSNGLRVRVGSNLPGCP